MGKRTCCGDDVREKGMAVMEETWNRYFYIGKWV
jgi:hypothetical protein